MGVKQNQKETENQKGVLSDVEEDDEEEDSDEEESDAVEQQQRSGDTAPKKESSDQEMITMAAEEESEEEEDEEEDALSPTVVSPSRRSWADVSLDEEGGDDELGLPWMTAKPQRAEKKPEAEEKKTQAPTPPPKETKKAAHVRSVFIQGET